MKTLLTAICLGTSLSLLAQSAIQESKPIADRSLLTLRQLVTEQNAQAMGFASAKDAALAQLQPPLPVFMVELNDLRSYQAGNDPNRLLKPLEKVIYPVSVREEVRSSITVEKVRGQWQASNFGSPNQAKMLARTRRASQQETDLQPESYFAVQIPALNAFFVGYRSQGTLMLRSILDDPTLNLTSEKSTPAGEVFGALSVPARQHDGLPR